MLKIFNTLGEEIETLVNEEKPAGTYEVNWNAANLPSGVYFYRLQAGDFVETKKNDPFEVKTGNVKRPPKRQGVK